MSQCPSVPVSQCPSVPVSQCPSVPVSQCPSVPVSQCPSVPVSQCPSVPVYLPKHCQQVEFYLCNKLFHIMEAHASQTVEDIQKGSNRIKTTKIQTKCSHNIHKQQCQSLRIFSISKPFLCTLITQKFSTSLFSFKSQLLFKNCPNSKCLPCQALKTTCNL